MPAKEPAAPAATFIVSGQDGQAPGGPRAAADAALASRAGRWRDLALRETYSAAPAFVGTAWLTAGGAAVYVAGSAAGRAWLALTIALHLVWTVDVWRALRRPLRRVQGRSGAPRFVGRVSACMGSLAIAPWLLPEPATAPTPFWLCTVLAASLALVGGTTAAPLPAAALAAVLLPLSTATWAAWHGAPAAALAGACASLLGAGVAWSRYRLWRQGARALSASEQSRQRLRAERDAALRADEEKSRFLAIASHDLRQPVHALGLFAATLEKRLAGSAEEPLARNMMRSIDGLDRSFNAMLDISRLDAGTVEPNIQHFALRDLFRRLHMHFAGQAELRGLGLRLAPGGKSVNSDPQLLERILGNLVQNAIKYTEEGGVVVVARSTSTHVNIEVWDTGVGIAAPDLPRVFDEFYQVGHSERSRAQGLGIGLAIVKRLAILLGHALTVSSRPGRGTMFRIGIPLQGVAQAQDPAPADTLPMPLLQTRTVLVIDDEEPIREGLTLLLEEWGYGAVSAGSIVHAERVLASLELPPDLILSDLHLGDGPDGIAAIEAVRAWCGYDVAAILITGDTSREEIRRATDSGHPVLFKPVQPRRLYNVVRGLVS